MDGAKLSVELAALLPSRVEAIPKIYFHLLTVLLVPPHPSSLSGSCSFFSCLSSSSLLNSSTSGLSSSFFSPSSLLSSFSTPLDPLFPSTPLQTSVGPVNLHLVPLAPSNPSFSLHRQAAVRHGMSMIRDNGSLNGDFVIREDSPGGLSKTSTQSQRVSSHSTELDVEWMTLGSDGGFWLA